MTFVKSRALQSFFVGIYNGVVAGLIIRIAQGRLYLTLHNIPTLVIYKTYLILPKSLAKLSLKFCITC